jgi:type II restriction enzyme
MDTCIYDQELIADYKSGAQIARVLTENWYVDNMYCPCCLNKSVKRFPNNTKVSDLYCEKCNNKFESKGSSKPFSKRVVDGEYSTMIKVINSDSAPNFFLMHYSTDDWLIKNLSMIPNFFMTSSMIEKRTALSDSARRHGWVGCNILISNIPEEGKINVIRNEQIIDKMKVNNLYQKMIFLKSKDPKFRGWTLDVLRCVQNLDKTDFVLKDLYNFKNNLKELHPENQHIEAKIRQQLQILRDNNILKFNNRGTYSLTR